MAKIKNTVKRTERDFGPGNSIIGFRGDVIELNKEDVELLCDMEPDQIKEYLERVKPRLVKTELLKTFAGKV